MVIAEELAESTDELTRLPGTKTRKLLVGTGRKCEFFGFVFFSRGSSILIRWCLAFPDWEQL